MEKMTGIFIFPDNSEKISNYADYIKSIQSEIVKYFGSKHCKTDNEQYPLVVIKNTNVSQDDLNNVRNNIEERYSYSTIFLVITGSEEDFDNKISQEILSL